MADTKVRVTFSCDSELKEKLTEKSNAQGITRSQLIVELLEFALGAEDEGYNRGAEVNRFIFDIQQRIADLEAWRREIQEWARSSDENTDNLETTLASLLNQQVSESGLNEIGKTSDKKKIPSPKK